MKTKTRFLWFAGLILLSILVLFYILYLLLRQQLTPEDQLIVAQLIKNHAVYIVIALTALLAVFGFYVEWVYRNYISPVTKIVEQIEIINSVNPSLRVQIQGSEDVKRLLHLINRIADRYESDHIRVDERVTAAKTRYETERNILATVMSELPEGVLICNAEGQILFYNRQAKKLLGKVKRQDGKIEPTKHHRRLIGIGRSVFRLIDKDVIVLAVEEIMAKLQKQISNPISHFAVAGNNGTLLEAEVFPLLSPQDQLSGIIFILQDISRKISADNAELSLLQTLSRNFRSSLASITSAIELISDYPELTIDHQEQLKQIIREESAKLGKIVDNELHDHTTRIQFRWPLMPMLIENVLDSLTHRLKRELDIDCDIIMQEATSHFIRVDSYSLGLAISFLFKKIFTATRVKTFSGSVESEKEYLKLYLSWKGPGIRIDTLREWEQLKIIVNNEEYPFSLGEIIGHHHIELLAITTHNTANPSHIVIYIPKMAPVGANRNFRKITITLGSRPEFYDFDLFKQAGQTPEVENRLLTDLSYTIFDTETTGLDPMGGDEIVAVGAVRIVNSRLLRAETFEQLVDPGRDIPRESIKIHGILPDMVQGQPTIEQVLPAFHQYAENTVLVGHNVAFDMRMLQVKEEKTGITMINPVLDTLHLSAVVHPSHDTHTLTKVARRLGVSVIGRHTALGDALTTAEIFLKLIPLLAEKHIFTLKEAMIASRKTYYSRLRY
ncbi:MAG: PAS domain-containing protein [Desulfobacteraceae bacterium]|nr:PAS domain-containing protein [Desulfobacteraceae bacterium]